MQTHETLRKLRCCPTPRQYSMNDDNRYYVFFISFKRTELKRMTRKEKITLSVLAFVVMIPITIGIITVKEKHKCLKHISQDGKVIRAHIIAQYVAANTYSKHATILYEVGGKKYYLNSPPLNRTFQNDFPVFVSYSVSHPDCAILITDTVLNYKGKQIRCFIKKHQGWDWRFAYE